MKIAFLYSGGRIHRIERVAQGKAMDDFFYGSLELREKGHEIGLFELSENAWHPIITLLGKFLNDRALLFPKTKGFLLAQTWDILKSLSGYDVVVVAGSGVAFTMATWKQFGFLRIPIVAIHAGLLNFKYKPFQRWLTRHLLHKMWNLLFGDGEYQPLCDIMVTGTERVIVNQFGTDIHFWKPGRQERDYILSIGNDSRRDFDLLMTAASDIRVPFKVVTRIKINKSIPQNVEIIKGDMRLELLSDEDMRELYQGAKCVVIPLVESFQPSGQSVCLQAMACGRPVVLTKTKGLWSESLMRDGDNILFVPPGDKDSLVKRIQYLLNHPDERIAIGDRAREMVIREFDMKGYAERLEKACETAVATGY
jgi:glycosyltransferase involved in cell wall biosynthesis